MDVPSSVPTSVRLRQHGIKLEAQVGPGTPPTLSWLAAPIGASSQLPPGTDKVRRFMDVYDGADSWSRTERIVARVETGDGSTDTCLVVTDLTGKSKALYDRA